MRVRRLKSNVDARRASLSRGPATLRNETNPPAASADGIGNQALQRALRLGTSARTTAQKSPLTIGAVNDPVEHEADRVADRAMATSPLPAIGRASPHIQRFSDRATEPTDFPAPDSVGRVLASPGHPLDAPVRRDMEQRFEHDFSRVRLHTGPAAERSAIDVDADAYTAGHDIVLGASRTALGAHDSRRLLAHELTHVVQASGRDQHAGAEQTIRRRPNKKRKTTDAPKRRTVVAMHLRPHDKAGAVGYVDGEPAPVPIQIDQNDLDEGSYAYRKRDKPETEFVEFEREDGGKSAFAFKLDKGLGVADRVIVEVQAAEFDFAAFAQQKFDEVPEVIKIRLIQRGGHRLKTPEELLGFANFAQSLLDRGVTEEMLILYQTHARGGEKRPFDWAHDWQLAADEVLGAQGELQKEAEKNTAAFQTTAKTIPNVPDKTYKLYQMSKWMPELRPMASMAMADAGIDVDDLEAMRNSLMEPFDARLHLETNAALDRLEGGLLLTKERYIRDKGALKKIDAMRAAAKSPKVKELKASKEHLDDARDDARDEFKDALMGNGDVSIDDAKKAMDAANAAYEEGKHEYLQALEDVSGVPVASWRGFHADNFFYARSSDRSQNVLDWFVSQTLRDVARARRELGKDPRTYYKADMMVQRTKNVLGVASGSMVEHLVDERVEEYLSAPWWEKLLDILSLALMFVPGGAIVTAARLGVGAIQTVNTIDEQGTASTLASAELKQEGGSGTAILLSAAGSVGDIGDLAKAAKGVSAVVSTGSKLEKTAAKVADTAVTTGAKVESTATKAADEAASASAKAEQAVVKDATEVPKPAVPEKPAAPPAAPPVAAPDIKNATPTTYEDAFDALEQETKHLPQPAGPVKGQKMGEAAPGPVQAKPSRFSDADRQRLAQDEANLAAKKKANDLADLKQRNPDAHADVVKPAAPLQSGQKLDDWAINNSERAEHLHKEWVDGVARGDIKKTTSFRTYVKKRLSGDRGTYGELEDAFVRGQDEIMVKAPKAKSNLRGSDSMSYHTGSRRIKYLDNKAVQGGTSVGKISALQKNLVYNMTEDIDDLVSVIGREGVPPEIANTVLPRLRAARDEVEAYVNKNGLKPEDLYDKPGVSKAVGDILDKHGIDRMMTTAGGGEGARLSKKLKDAGFKTE